jgi:predicted RNA-binding Zn ribbon-like protein
VLALELAATVRHDGHGGLLDLLADGAGVQAWLERTAPAVTEILGRSATPSPAVAGPVLVDLRVVVRNLFARAVRPALLPLAEVAAPLDADAALRRLNRTADYLGTPQLSWLDDATTPTATWSPRGADPVRLLTGAVARSAIDFLTGPDLVRLRACPAARCVRYFLQADPRQTWCSPACGNRERVNRHYRKRTH